MTTFKHKKKLVAFNGFGGKSIHLKWLLPLLPDCYHYVELFGYTGAVLLNRPTSSMETFNEINGDVTNFFAVLRNHTDELVKRLKLTPYSEKEFCSAWEIMKTSQDEIEQARCFYIRSRMSYAGLGTQKGWNRFGYDVKESRNGVARGVSKFHSATNKLYEIADRFKKVQMLNRDALDIIERFDSEGNLFYADPPYLLKTRSGPASYKYELPEEKHIELSEKLRTCKTFVAISHYNCDVYNELYDSWYKFTTPEMTTSMGNRKIRECLWTNYDPELIHSLKLFDKKY